MTDMEKLTRAIEATANAYGCSGTHDHDLIANMLNQLLTNLTYQIQFGDADLEADRAAHERMELNQ